MKNTVNSSTPQGVVSLRAEYRQDALGVGVTRPRLSWNVQVDRPGWEQSAYQLTCDRGQGLIEQASRVETGNSTLVAWPFAPLRSRERVSVQLTVWGRDGQPLQTRIPLQVEAGLLDPGDWRARFITSGVDEDPAVEHPAALFRCEFEVKPGLVSARLYSSALGVYEALLNGGPVSDAVLSPGWTSYKHRLRYQVTDVTGMLATGDNLLAARVGEGWFRGRIGFLGGRRNRYGERTAFLGQLELRYADGSIDHVITDPAIGWSCSTGGIRMSSIYDGETYDARLEPQGWTEPGFDARAWSGVREVAWDLQTLTAEEGPAVRRTEVLRPVAISRSPAGKLLVDFGQNLVGWTRIRVSGRAGRTITLRHAEVLEGGELCTRPLRIAKATDTYILRGEGVEVWEPRFTFHGFRYVEVEGWPGELAADDIAGVVVHSDMVRTGWFECSNAEVNRLHENVVWGMRGNFLDIPTDCPQRDERLGWTGDLQVFAPTATYLFDVGGFLSSWLRDLAAEQGEDGMLPILVPDTIRVRPSCAGWGDAAAIVPWVLYERTGDVGVLQRQYASMKGWVEQVLDRVSGSGLWDWGMQLGDWLDPGAPGHEGGRRTNPYVVASAFLVNSLSIVTRVARILGETEDEARYNAAWQRTRDAFRAHYVTSAGRVMSDSQTAYAMALRFGLLDEEQREAAGARLNELVAQEGFRIGTGFLGTPLVCDALVETGHLDTAYRLLLQTEAPSWLYAVRLGATTIWERWDSLLPDGSVNPNEMTSFNHYAFGAIADWLHRCVGGLAPGAPGYRKVIVQPQPGGDLAWARTRHITPYGEAAVRWEIKSGMLRVEAVVPPNTTADVRLPGQPAFTVGAGDHAWEVPYAPASTATPLTVDSNLVDLRADKALWAALAAAIGAVDASATAWLDSPSLAVVKAQTLRDVLGLHSRYRDLVEAVQSVFQKA
ncbi:MAG TPA: glycoside hydrolase family 78 protein [Burkholderiaceae bacterium]|nr:glycoside hydrolase family 78 protein [Burkholderiaceae bacterium]